MPARQRHNKKTMGRTSARLRHGTAAAHTAAAAHTMVQRLSSTVVQRLSMRAMTIDMRGAGGAGGRSSSTVSTSTTTSCKRRRRMRRWWLLRLLLRLERFRCEADAAVSAMVGERHCCASGLQAGHMPREVTHSDENARPGICYLPGYF